MLIGDQVRALRKARGWTQVELAERSGITQGMITNIERNRYPNPTQNTLLRLATAFGISLDKLTGVPSTATETEDLPGSRLEEWATAIVAIGPKLTPIQRVAVLEHARALEAGNSRG